MIGTIVIHWNGGWCPGCKRSYPEGTRACRCTDPNTPELRTERDVLRAAIREYFVANAALARFNDAEKVLRRMSEEPSR